MSTLVRPECGTYGGYQQHRRRSETACDDCREANRVYHRNVRAGNPKLRQREAAASSARSRALTRLAAEYPERFKALLAEEIRSAEQPEGSDRDA